MISGIYKILNIVNGKLYIGSGANLRRRKREHFCRLKSNTHINKFLQNSWNKYGGDSFVFEIIELTNTDDLIKREQYWIDHYISYDKKKGYNIRTKADSNLGIKLSEETKKKISKGCKNKGRPRMNPLLKVECVNCNIIFETYIPGRRFCSLACATTFNNKKGSTGIKGTPHSEEAKRKMSLSRSGENNVSKRPDVKEKIRQKMFGREITWSHKVKGQKRPNTSQSLKNYHMKRRQAT